MQKIYLVKAGFKRLKAADKVVRAKEIATKMTGNPNYSDPTPKLEDVKTSANNLYDALQNQNGSKESTALKNTAEASLDLLISSLAGYVQAASSGDENKILSSGFDVRNAKTPPVKLGPVSELTAKLSLNQGEVILKWKGLKGSKLYVVGSFADGQVDTYKPVGESTKATVSISNLESGKVYFFRIAAINAAGLGTWSEVIGIKAY